uniref:Protein TIC 214 n=1 Tax=Berchemia lineata TaxID=1603695 RepID=A0A7L8XKP5_9ROSA|nr:hypothetical chloroplast RF19 [Berchemia lineata]QOH97733.1 hypothetical chloroplast RF19 [Berchemia lineata]WRM54044.1 hypothetical chloroplast RF1 [Phyllanthus cochinchinensis]
MIFKSFILANLVSLCMKIINSVVVVGLYYGFLTTFSMGPSYLFLLRARVIEEGTEKKVSATTGFITGQLMTLISIYYAPMHLALGRPHTITVLALPYLLFHFFFFWNNHKYFESTTRNSLRNFSIQCVFLNNLIFQLFNHFILPSAMLFRLVNIYMFRCNNKMLFVTSSFVGWLIGHFFFMKWIGLLLVWIQQNNSIRSNVLIRSNKYLVSELRNSIARIFTIFLFSTCIYSLGRIPSPILTKKLKETSTSEREEREEETDIEIESTSETKGTKQEQEGSNEEDHSFSLFSEEKGDVEKIDEMEEIRVNGKEKKKNEDSRFKETSYKNKKEPVYETFSLGINPEKENSKFEFLIDKKDKDLSWFEKPFVTFLFDYKRWNCPLRYIKNDRFENAVRKEMSQYFFYTCRSDGKERISFTYPPSLSTFLEMIERKMSLFTTEKFFSGKLHNRWNYKNEQKTKNLNNEFRNRVKTLDKKSFSPNTLEKKIRLCNDETKKEYLSKKYDPFLSGSCRGRIQFFFSPSSITETSINNYIDIIWINKIHLFLLIPSYRNFEPKITTFNQKSLSTEICYFLNLINEFVRESTLSFNFKGPSLFPDHKDEKMDLKDQIKFLKILFDAILADPNNKTILKNFTGLKEISKQVPQWSYKLIDDLEQQEAENEENAAEDHEIRSRKAKRVVIFTDNEQNIDISKNPKDTANSDQINEVALIRYSQQPDFRRDIIKGSVRAQRRKTVIWQFFQANVHSPLFLDRIAKSPLFSFDIFEPMKIFFINWVYKNTESAISDYTYPEKKTKESEKKEEDKREEEVRIEIAEAWDSIIFAQVIRGCVLVTQSNIRKFIQLPLLIIVKNIIRMLLFQFPEWSEDFKDWNREMHVKCTYNGVPLSETEFPKNWLTDGIQIKILFPFRLKPWHRSKQNFSHKDPIKKKERKNDFCFLTVGGMEAELPFGSPRRRLSLFEPLFKKLDKKIRKLKKKSFLVITILKEKADLSKKRNNWLFKNILFLKEITKKFCKSKKKSSLFFGFKQVYELNETKKEKDLIRNNVTVQTMSTPIRSMNWTNFSLTKKKRKDLMIRRNTIINQIQKITKEREKRFITSEKNISPNKITYNATKLKSSKSISQKLKRRNARLIRKSHFFIKIWIEKIYINFFLGIINIPRINAQFFLDSKRKISNKNICNNEESNKKIGKTNPKKIHFISIIKKSLNINNSNFFTKNSQIFCDVSSLSQAYVFYKLSQTRVIHLYKLRSVLQYHGESLFLKNEIKDFFGNLGLFHFELKDTSVRNFGTNQWKNWLKDHYQDKYDLSQIRWCMLIPQKWRNRINQHRTIQKQDLNKFNLYKNKKEQLIHYEKTNFLKTDALRARQKNNLKKDYRYNLLSYKSIFCGGKKESYIYEEEAPLKKKKKHAVSYNYNTAKNQNFDMLIGLSINNYLTEDDIFDMEKNLDRKFFDWRILHFCLRKKVDIQSWIESGTKQNIKTKTRTNKNQKIDNMDNKDLFFLTLRQDQEIKPSNSKKKLFDWMGMNEETLNRPISNLELWFFAKFVTLYNAYKINPWAIPTQLLLLNLNRNENVIENKKVNGKKNSDLFLSNEKKPIELENQNYQEKKFEDQVDLGSVLANKERGVEEDYAKLGLGMKKGRKKKQYKSNIEAELDFLLKRYLRFQLKWDDSLNQKIINNIKVYCLLLRLTNSREIFISSIQKGETSLDILMIEKGFTLIELMKGGIFIIEPVRLSVRKDGQFILYQSIGILWGHKSKQLINQKYRENVYFDKTNFRESIESHQRLIGHRNKNDYDLLVPENILSPKRRKELRILISFNSKKSHDSHINTEISNGNNIKNCDNFLNKNKHFNRKKLIKLKFFLWPNYRLEDLACMNRYWFDTNNASRFSMVRIHIYPRLKFR